MNSFVLFVNLIFELAYMCKWIATEKVVYYKTYGKYG